MKRNQSLDVLRGIAVLLVILYHSYRLIPFGWIGVDLFFVLSGFLISGLLFNELKSAGRISVGRFLLRRGMKIYPPYFVYLLVTSFFVPQLRRWLPVQSAFLQNYRYTAAFPWPLRLWTHTWSVAVEEHFYVLLPFVLVGLYRFGKLHWIPTLSLALMMICFALRVFALRTYGELSGVLFHSQYRADELFAGVALGYFWHYHRERFVRLSDKPLWIFGLLPIASVLWNPLCPVRDSLLVSADVVGFVAILIWSLPRETGLRGVAYIGRYSYSIYLWHIAALERFVSAPLLTLFAGALRYHSSFAESHATLHAFNGFVVVSLSLASQISIVFGVGIVMAKMIEFPALRLRDRYVRPPGRGRDLAQFKTVAAESQVAYC